MNAEHINSSDSGGAAPAEKTAVKDVLSGLLQKDAANRYILRRIGEMRPSDRCALFLIRIRSAGSGADDREEKGRKPSAVRQNTIIQQTGRVLSALFRPTDIAGRLDENTFLVFLTCAVTEESASEKAALLCRSLRSSDVPGTEGLLKAQAGIYLASGSGLQPEALYDGAREALKRAARGRKDYCCINGMASASSEREHSGFLSSDRQLFTLLENLEEGVCLLEAADSIRITRISPGFYRLLGMKRDSLPLPCGLKRLGIHPDYAAEYEQLRRKRQNGGASAQDLRRGRPLALAQSENMPAFLPGKRFSCPSRDFQGCFRSYGNPDEASGKQRPAPRFPGSAQKHSLGGRSRGADSAYPQDQCHLLFA